MYNEPEPKNVMVIEGKVGFEWLLTTQISKIRNSKDDNYQKNVLDLKEMLYPYTQESENDLDELCDDYTQKGRERKKGYELRIEELKQPIIEKFKGFREPAAIRALEIETSKDAREWGAAINFYSDLRPFENEICLIRHFRTKIKEEEKKETFLYYRAMYNFCMEIIYEIGLLPRDETKDEQHR